MNPSDKIRVRVFIKAYLSLKPKVSAKELAQAINEVDIGLRTGVTANEIAKDLHSNIGKRNMLGMVDFVVENNNNRGFVKKYYLKR